MAPEFPFMIVVLVLACTPVRGADPKEWELEGRPLPEALLPPPALDPALRDYRACDLLEGRVEGSAPAILPRLVHRWVAAFRAHHPKAEVSVPPPYLAPQGALSPPLQRFLEGRLDFAFVSRDLAAADVAAFRRAHGYEPLVVPVAGGSYAHFGFVDAVAIVVHKDNPLEGLTFAQVDALFSRTRLRGAAPARRWGDLGVAPWATQPIHVVGSGAWAGEESARAITIRDRVLSAAGRRGEWRDDLVGMHDTEAQVPEKVAADRHAIGFTGMGHVGPGVKALALARDGAGPWIAASYENVAAAAYPLARTVDLVLARRPGAALDPTIEAFVRFLLSREGQRIVRQQNVLLPLTAAQADASLALLGEVASCAKR